MRERRWLLLTLCGLLIVIAVSDALKATRPKFKIVTTSTTSSTTKETVASESAEDEIETITATSSETNITTGHTLTGIPQIDYIWDPNLPRELNGYNLSDYPFYSNMPEDIDFKCDGLHDGFYASVPHKCQVYHHCLFGTRYDFLCANFTAFDQKTFICHFVSEVDCANSKKYWHRNDALYKAADPTPISISTTTTTTTTTTASSIQSVLNVNKSERLPSRERDLPPRRRRPPARRPTYDYYDDDYYDEDYERLRPRGYNRRDYDDYEDRKYLRDRERDRDYRHRDFRERNRETPVRKRFSIRSNRRDIVRIRDTIEDEPLRSRIKDQDTSRARNAEDRTRDGDEKRFSDKRFKDDYDEKDSEPGFSTNDNEDLIKPGASPTSVFAKPRIPPKLRRPVPLSEQDKYAYSTSTTIRTLNDEFRRRPAVTIDDLEEPRRRPIIVDLEESHRKTIADSLEEPRRKSAADNSEEMRRRPLDVLDDYYYEDEIEEIRPRWQMRGRPLRDRDFLDKRYRDRLFRSRYRDDKDDVRSRIHLERSRDRFYEKERERGPDRGRDRSLDRTKDQHTNYDHRVMHIPDFDKLDRLLIYSRLSDRNRESERPQGLSRSKISQDFIEAPKKVNEYDRTTTEQTINTTKSKEQEKEIYNPLMEETKNRSQKHSSVKIQPNLEIQQQEQLKHSQIQYHKVQEITTEKELPQKYWNPALHLEIQNNEKEEPLDDYPSEYYDDIEETTTIPLPVPRSTIRVIKRPFLPSRGGNLNPRGLLPVGSKAVTFSRREENPLKHYIKLQMTTTSYRNEDDIKEVLKEDYQNKDYIYENQHIYNSYKNFQQPDSSQKQPSQQTHDTYDTVSTRPIVRKPESEISKRRIKTQSVSIPQKGISSWTTDYKVQEQNNEANTEGNEQQSRDYIWDPQNDNLNIYNSSHKNEDVQQVTPNGNFKIKQKINEVTHHNLQDIPESEYDVTLNEALTPNLNQEPNLPSGFVLPLHRQFEKDTVLQSSENSYKFSMSLNQQHKQQEPQQIQQQIKQQTPQQMQLQVKQQTVFGSGNQFVPISEITTNSDKGKTVYFRSPETIQISETQYKQQRAHWVDYTGF